MAHVLYDGEHKNYSYALFMKIIKRWYSLYHKGDCFSSMQCITYTRMHSDPFCWLCPEGGSWVWPLTELCHSMLWHFGVQGNYVIWFPSEHSQGTLFCSVFEIGRTRGSLEAAVMMNADSAMLRCLPAWRGAQGYLGSSGVCTMSINAAILPIRSTLLQNPSYK